MWMMIGAAALFLLLIAVCLLPTIERCRMRYFLAHGQETKALITDVRETGYGYLYRGKPVVYTLKVEYKAEGERRTGTLHTPGLSKEEFPGFKAGMRVPIKYLPEKPNEIALTLPITLRKMESVSYYAHVGGPALAVLFAVLGVVTLRMVYTRL